MNSWRLQKSAFVLILILPKLCRLSLCDPCHQHWKFIVSMVISAVALCTQTEYH